MVLTKFPPIFFDEIFSTKVRLGWVRLGLTEDFFVPKFHPDFFLIFFDLGLTQTRFSMNFCMIFYFRFFPPDFSVVFSRKIERYILS